MAKIIVAMIGGVVLGTLVTLAATQFESSSNTTPEDFVRDINVVPKMAQAVADKHRKEQYIHLTSVEAIIALPTAFARSEALYAIAGRSDAAEVQNLIFEGNRIADEVERIELHKILFFRLTELDPDSALALARVDDFKGIKPIEQVVWHTWARNDLDGALIAAKNQVSLVHQNSAAQSLYAAFGYMGNETTDRIEAVLGIGPSRASRGLFLYQLADRSPAVAIAFINGLERGIEQQEYVSWLAFYVSLSDAKAALAYAKLFAVALDATNYTTIINRLVASDNPRVTIERSLASGGISRRYRLEAAPPQRA